MDQETKRILTMIEEGKLTAAQGAKLLSAMGKKALPEPGVRANETNAGQAERPRFIGIHITDSDDQVNVRIPIGLVSCVEKFMPKAVVAKVRANNEEFDLGELMDAIKHSTGGDVLSVDATDGTKVRICCE